MSTNY